MGTPNPNAIHQAPAKAITAEKLRRPGSQRDHREKRAAMLAAVDGMAPASRISTLWPSP